VIFYRSVVSRGIFIQKPPALGPRPLTDLLGDSTDPRQPCPNNAGPLALRHSREMTKGLLVESGPRGTTRGPFGARQTLRQILTVEGRNRPAGDKGPLPQRKLPPRISPLASARTSMSSPIKAQPNQSPHAFGVDDVGSPSSVFLVPSSVPRMDQLWRAQLAYF
jgi:hypothetical protein